MIEDVVIWLIVLGIGFLIGYNWSPKDEKSTEDLPSDVQKLQEQLIIYKNLKESLLQDVRYWRDRAKQK